MEPLLKRALELAERGRGTTHPNPVVGAVLAHDADIVGEGWHAEAGGPHAEVIALANAGARASGATLYVSLEPCAHHGRTPPCVDAIIAAGVERVVAASADPGATSGGGLERLAAAGVEVELADTFEARVQNEAWRMWIRDGRPYVTYKVAATLDGRVSIPGRRWVSGEASRRLVHELRAASDAVGVGMGTVRADDPRLDARDVGASRQPRRLAFGKGPLPEGSTLELHSGSLRDELATLAGEGVQSLLLEGGPTLATAFLEEALVDKVLLFLASSLSGEGPLLVGALAEPLDLLHTSVERVGEDLLVSGYIREP